MIPLGIPLRKLEKDLDYETLESILIKAAQETGLKYKVVHPDENEEARKYDCSIIKLKGQTLPALRIYIPRGKNPINHIGIGTGFPYGYAHPKKINQYYNTFFRNLQNLEK